MNIETAEAISAAMSDARTEFANVDRALGMIHEMDQSDGAVMCMYYAVRDSRYKSERQMWNRIKLAVRHEMSNR